MNAAAGDSFVIGIDGGNSKTEVLLVDHLGAVCGHAIGPGSSAHHLGLAAAVAVIADVVAAARGSTGKPCQARAAHAAVCVAGVDLPHEQDALLAAAIGQGWADQVSVRNDTFALLHAGTAKRWGVALVIGAGTNCVGVSADGRVEGYLALGFTTGDRGGGYDLGRLALHHATRADDGRGPRTLLATLIPRHFGLVTAMDVAIALHRGQLGDADLVELPPLVFAAADRGDAVAGALVRDQALEGVTTVTTIVRRLGLTDEPVPVVLGGGLLTADGSPLVTPIVAGIREQVPHADVAVTRRIPAVGAALLALDAIGAGAAAGRRLLEHTVPMEP